ncbi:non-structural maintenance of chromosomes element 1 homolog [Caerostris extrusa]|uniref:Non-structural maintenance of chromosomes element 1 homolog n=1 Tax=Caerostris extrusa TaxID=172846 RepID=A0AAV4VVH8_CAEEX|nr:non-structural maintenance of chromosomes element 1 homolog [Caerostris extrusa]
MGDLEDQHKIFLQSLMWKKICDYDEVKTLYQECHDKVNVEPGDLSTFINKINENLKPLQMAILKGVDELTGKSYYMLINRNNNNISRLFPQNKVQELEVFKSIIASIVKSEDGKISSTDALNLQMDLKIMKKEINEILLMFKRDGWLYEEEGYYFFSTRAITELQPFFRENYPDDISNCYMCKNIIFQGSSCESCNIKLHNYCKKSYFLRSTSKQNACPACLQNYDAA